MFFTIEQVSLNRLPSKNDPKVIRVLWASEAIYINVKTNPLNKKTRLSN